MQKSTKAACLSALLLPGSGHCYLKCYIRGTLFISITLAALYIILSTVMGIVTTITEGIQMGHVVIDNTLLPVIEEKFNDLFQSPALLKTKMTLFVTWFISTVDAYRIGRSRESTIQQHEPLLADAQ